MLLSEKGNLIRKQSAKAKGVRKLTTFLVNFYNISVVEVFADENII
jgi:hypothetical protein